MFSVNGFGLFLLVFVLVCVGAGVPLWNASSWPGVARLIAALPEVSGCRLARRMLGLSA